MVLNLIKYTLISVFELYNYVTFLPFIIQVFRLRLCIMKCANLVEKYVSNQ